MPAPIDEIPSWIDATTRFLAPLPVALEWLLTILAALIIWRLPFGGFLPPVHRAFVAIARRRAIAILISGLLPIAIRLSLLGVVPVPEPSIHDEFSHLLLADTLAHGRLANPTHPMWQHFESIHIIQKPTYASMYPPGQGAFLAVGQVLFRDPWAGVVISVALMSMAFCWMLQGWLPPQWAFYGALLAGFKIGIVGLWINSYMGGAVSALGGALLLGALPRKAGIPAGIGVVLLMSTRPFDGAVLTLAALVYLIHKKSLKPLIPAAAILACGVAVTGYYNYRVTGSPMRLPYQVNRDTYGWPENLAFLPAKKLSLRDPILQKMYLREIAQRDAYNTPGKIAENLLARLFDNWIFFIGPLLTVPLLFITATPLLLFVGVIAALNLLQLVLYPYHLGPIVCALFALVTLGVRRLYTLLNPSRALTLVAILPLGILLIAAMKQSADDLHIKLPYWDKAEELHHDSRAYIAKWLADRPGKQLVIVHYGPYHHPNQEWVYNGADIDNSKVVWAREVSPKSDADLIRCLPGREVWLLRADDSPQRVVPYP